MQGKYKKNTDSFDKTPTSFSTFHGLSQPPDWAREIIDRHEERLEKKLNKLFARMAQASQISLKELKPIYHRFVQWDFFKDARNEVLAEEKSIIQEVLEDRKKKDVYVMELSLPTPLSDPIQASIQEMRFQESRAALRSMPMEDRIKFCKDHCHDKHLIQSLTSNPLPGLLPETTLKELRTTYAMGLDLNIEDYLQDGDRMVEVVRRHFREIEGLVASKLEVSALEDSATLAQRLEPFPVDEHVQSLRQPLLDSDRDLRERYLREIKIEESKEGGSEE